MRPSTEIDTLRQQLPYRRLRQVRKGKVLPIDWPTEWERFDANELFAFDLATIPPKLLENMRKRADVLMDGNQAAISVLTRLVDGLCGYPITPSTPIAETFARVAAHGHKNLFGNELMYFQPSDELSAIAAVEAMACQGGRYADNTSSQGLLLKTKNLFSVAGKRLPVLMTVMAREVNKGSLSIHCGHTDFYAVRNAGWAQLMSEDNQEMHDLLPVAFKVSELKQVMLPTMVIGDGFIKSHAIENIKELSNAFLEYYVGPPNRMYQPNFEHGTLTGTFTDTDLTMEGQVAQDLAYRFFKRGFVIAMNNMNKILGTNLKVVDCYRTEDADMVVVILGSAAGVIKDVVDYYRDVKGYKIGVVRPVLFNPPCYEELAYGMRKAKVISVMERTGTGQLFMDFATGLTGHQVGGPGKVAVVSSSLFGAISGSAVANVMVTGHVELKNEDSRLLADELHYRHETQFLFAQSPVEIIGDGFQLNADSMTLELDKKRAVFKGNVKGTFSEDLSL